MTTKNPTGEFEATEETSAVEPEWCEAKPAVIPEPTFWPLILALGATIGLWGMLTSWVFVVTGLLMSLVSLFYWITELRQ